jgi:hypothetical protein
MTTNNINIGVVRSGSNDKLMTRSASWCIHRIACTASKCGCRPRHLAMSLVVACLLIFIQFHFLHKGTHITPLQRDRLFRWSDFIFYVINLGLGGITNYHQNATTPTAMTITVWARLESLIPRDTEMCLVSQGNDDHPIQCGKLE